LSVQTVARRYAAALADVVIARDEAKEVLEEMSAWERMMTQNATLLEVFRNPTIPYDKKRNILNALIARAKLRPTSANFLQVLLKNQRLAELGEVNKRFAFVLDERAGAMSADVKTARPVPAAAQEALRAQLVKMTGKNVRLKFETDADLIGGIVTRIGSTIYDGSIRNKLERAKAQLIGSV
jgi:F-type H+-transporting ATPase subunit delta